MPFVLLGRRRLLRRFSSCAWSRGRLIGDGKQLSQYVLPAEAERGIEVMTLPAEEGAILYGSGPHGRRSTNPSEDESRVPPGDMIA